MDINNDDIVRFEESKYFVLTVFQEGEKKYAFMNKITEDEEDITDEYILVEVTPVGLARVTDENVLNTIGPRLQSELEQALADVEDDSEV